MRAFSVVIPTLREAAIIEQSVAFVRAQAGVEDVVVVDAGSDDATAARARLAGARVLQAPRGRGAQMNAGARAARSPNLIFMHADCRLPECACDAMSQVLDRGCVAGTFAIDYASRHPLLRLVSSLSRVRSRWTEFGEATLFVRRDDFERVGGFPAWPLFEDVEILTRLRRLGRVGRAHGRVQASPRRYLQRGVWRQQSLNVVLYTLFRFGFPPARLQRLYERGSFRRRTTSVMSSLGSPPPPACQERTSRTIVSCNSRGD
jgi:rSAM/selenodomain-associated transferase 2